ncbi:MAG: preprotein translocase subunit YajC [Myxococcota bacterium]
MSTSQSSQTAQGIPSNNQTPTPGTMKVKPPAKAKAVQTNEVQDEGQPKTVETMASEKEEPTSSPTGCGGESPIFSFVMLGAMFVLFYFFLIRPQKKRQKQHSEMLNSLVKGDKVITSGGIVGKIVSISDGRVNVRVGNKNTITVLKSHISGIDRSKNSKKDDKTKNKKDDKTE